LAGLNITALSEDILATPGNREPNYIVISITYTDGKPLRNLDSHDFAVEVVVAPAGGTVRHNIRVVETDFPGVYVMEVVPDAEEVWKAGVYIFAVGVHSGFDRGQTIVDVLLD
jgi:hypothetical protein